MNGFTDDQLERYKRNILLEEVGAEGQARLRAAKVLVVGTGGLGSPIIYYLAAAGVGTLGIADADVVDLSNLQRQILHRTADLGRLKVLSAKEKIQALNPDVTVQVHTELVTETNVEDIIRDYDFIVEATDNYTAKYLLNDACVRLGKPFSIGGIQQFRGQTFTHLPGTATYRCIYPEPSATASPLRSTAGVLGSVAGIIGTIQATETLKYLLGIRELLTDTLLVVDAKSMDMRKIRVPRNPEFAGAQQSIPIAGAQQK